MALNRILIIEDELHMASFLKMGLEENEYVADVAYDGITGKSMALSGKYDLFLLDVNIPQINGFQLCRLWRESGIQTPVLMVSALERIDDKLEGFDAGADDYLTKPFHFKELLARINVLLKRTRQAPLSNGKLKIADLEIDRDSKTISRAGISIELRSKEYYLLEYLAIHKDKVINRSELLEKIWGPQFDVNSNVVDVYINFLRKKMDKDFQKQLIHTRVGLGYVLKE